MNGIRDICDELHLLYARAENNTSEISKRAEDYKNRWKWAIGEIERMEKEIRNMEVELETLRLMRDEYDMIIRLHGAAKEAHRKTIKNQQTYLMKNKRNGLYKIGKSKNPRIREKTLQSEEPTVEMVKIWEEDIESTLHKKYAKQRVRGEWFKLTPIQVKYITKHY
jgi:site-specific DNA-adenine methylase